MIKNNGWLNALFSLVFIAVPALILYYFFLKDWGVTKQFGTMKWVEAKIVLSIGSLWGISIGFLFYSFIFSFLLVYLKILSYDSLSFSIPLTLVLISIFVTADIPIWGRALIVVALILFAFPINSMVSDLKRKQLKKNR